MGTATVWDSLRLSPWRLLRTRWPWIGLLYVVTSGLLLLPLLLLVPFVVVLPFIALAVGALERRRAGLLGFERPPSPHRFVERAGPRSWLTVRLTEAATWREAMAVGVDLVAGFVAVVLLNIQIALVAAVVWVVRGDSVGVRPTGSSSVYSTDSWWIVPVAVVALILFAYVNILFAIGQAQVVRLLVGANESELALGVERLTRARAVLVEGLEVERRRIERDLHDGAQQELVALGARLSIARLEVDELGRRGSDVEALRGALDAASEQASRATSSLRRTVRGLHPAILEERGLRAALDELRGVTAVPLELGSIDVPRVEGFAETAAYYVVTEAASNAAKHAGAERLRVDVRLADGMLEVVTQDDGTGGADEERGTGLRGLRQRAESLGGEFEIDSPSGGPTTLHLRIPTRSIEEPRAIAAG